MEENNKPLNQTELEAEATPLAANDTQETAEPQEATAAAEPEDKEEDDDFSLGGCLVVLVLVIAAAWALIHFNPSEEDHREAIGKEVAEAVIDMGADGYVMSNSGVRALMNIKYYSLGVCSWTTTKYHGRTVLTSIGILGWTQPLIQF